MTDPRGTALAKLVIGCLYTSLSYKKEIPRKRSLENDIQDEPSHKMRKLAQGAEHMEVMKDGKVLEQAGDINEIIGGFFKLMHSVLLCQVKMSEFSRGYFKALNLLRK